MTECYTGSFSESIIAANAGSNITIRGNTLRGGYAGLIVDDPGTSAQVEGNLIEDQDFGCILVRLGANVIATGNDFRRPAQGGYLVYCSEFRAPGVPVAISMENNYWGYQYADLISRYIWDLNDDPDLNVLIDFDPFAGASVPANGESWGSLKALFLGR